MSATYAYLLLQKSILYRQLQLLIKQKKYKNRINKFFTCMLHNIIKDKIPFFNTLVVFQKAFRIAIDNDIFTEQGS